MASPNCPNCGAPYRHGYLECEYCGTGRVEEDHTVPINIVGITDDALNIYDWAGKLVVTISNSIEKGYLG